MRLEGSVETTKPSRDALFSLLRNERRREVIRYLRGRTEPVELRELSEHVAAIENDCCRADVTYEQRKRVQTALYQMHLPKLDEQGVVSYDQRAGSVSLAPGAEKCLAYLDVDPGPVRQWWRWYLAAAGLVTVPLGFAAIGVSPFVSMPGLGYAVVAWTVFTLVAILQFAER
jgi:hypothetical protein